MNCHIMCLSPYIPTEILDFYRICCGFASTEVCLQKLKVEAKGSGLHYSMDIYSLL